MLLWGDYDSHTVASLLRVASILILIPASCAAQIESNQPAVKTSRGSVTVRGQIFSPEGGPIQKHLRFELISDNASRPPAYYFTDSHGRISLPGLTADASFTIRMETDDESYATTSVQFYTTGPRPTVQVDLRPLAREVAVGRPVVSVAELRQDIPAPARKEYDAGMEMSSRGELLEAQQRFARASELFSDFVAARNELSVLLMKQGDLAGAEAHLRRALATDATAVRPLLNLGLCLYRQLRYAEALPHLERATQLAPRQPGGHLLLGIALVMSGNDAAGEPILLRAYEYEGVKAARAQFYLSHIYTRRKDYARAAAALESYLRDRPEEPHAADLHRTLDKLRAASQK